MKVNYQWHNAPKELPDCDCKHLKREGNETATNCSRLKIMAEDGKGILITKYGITKMVIMPNLKQVKN